MVLANREHGPKLLLRSQVSAHKLIVVVSDALIGLIGSADRNEGHCDECDENPDAPLQHDISPKDKEPKGSGVI